MTPGRTRFIETLSIAKSTIPLPSIYLVFFQILVFLRPNGYRSEEQGTNTDGQVTQLLAMSARCWD